MDPKFRCDISPRRDEEHEEPPRAERGVTKANALGLSHEIIGAAIEVRVWTVM